MRNVNDGVAPDALRASQYEVVILASFESSPKRADLSHQSSVEHTQMREGVLTKHQKRIPIALEVWFDPFAVCGELILVAEQHARTRITMEIQHHHKERVFRKPIVVIEQRDKLARCKC
ncbi:hypothetical protein WS75_16250 [Burkholderia sp. FL-7-2-10-S1-D7]|nr:hypothetical protein WS75_16250 [Burkholderia sp. FL-7-2-10-S1-D7]